MSAAMPSTHESVKTDRDQPFRVYSFRRWSSRLQTDGDSDRRQLEAASTYCEEKGWTLDHQLVAPAQSGYHQKNGGPLASFFKLVEDKKVRPGDILIVEGFDRFSRQPPDLALPQFLKLIHAGLEIHTTLDRQVFTQTSVRKNQGQLYGTISAMWGAYLESHNKGDRVRKAWQKRRETPTQVCPAWLRPLDKPDANGLNFECIPERQRVIERIFKLALAGHGVLYICRVLNREKMPGFERHVLKGTKPVRRSADGWHHSYVRTLLRDRRIIGEAEFLSWDVNEKGETKRSKTGIVRKIYPAAIDVNLWQRVQDCRRQEHQGGNGAKMSNLVSKIARCKCGASMRLVRKGANSTYTYLQCSDAVRGQHCEHKKLHRYQIVEDFVLILFGELAFGDVQLDDAQASLRSKRDAARHEADDLRVQYQRLSAEIRKGKGGPLAAAELDSIEADHAEKLETVKSYDQQLAKLEVRPIAERLEEVRRLVHEMDNLKGDARIAARSRINRGFAEFIEKIVFNDPTPPPVAVRPAEYVEATEWYVWFAETFPEHILKGGSVAWFILMSIAQQRHGAKPKVFRDADGELKVTFEDVQVPLKQ